MPDERPPKRKRRADKNRLARRRAEYRKWIAEGRCGNCGRPQSLLSSTTCDKCINRSSARKIQRYKKAKAEGTCVICYKEKAWQSYALCLACRTRASENQRKRRGSNGG